jgi:hypothetical protein
VKSYSRDLSWSRLGLVSLRRTVSLYYSLPTSSNTNVKTSRPTSQDVRDGKEFRIASLLPAFYLKNHAENGCANSPII